MSTISAAAEPRTPDADTSGIATVLRLPGWSPIEAAGADCETFLQGQLSADLRSLCPEQALWAGYHSAKGRLLAVPLLVRDGDAVQLWLPAGLIEAVLKRLKMYVLRARVTLTAPAGPAAWGLLGRDSAQWLEARGLPCPVLSLQMRESDGLRVLRAAGPAPRYLLLGTPARLSALAPQAADGAYTWRAADIRAGVPVISPETQDRWVAQMVNLDLLGGVSFDKGCYTGQEVVARLHYLGNLKKRMFLLTGDGAPPAPGCAIHETGGDTQAVGEIVDAAAEGIGFVATAVLQISRRQSAALHLAGTGDRRLSVPQAFPGV